MGFFGSMLLVAGCRDEEVIVSSPGPSAMVVVLDGVRTEEFTSDRVTSDLTGVTGEDYADQTWATLGPDAATVRFGLNERVTITAPAHATMVEGRFDPLANFPVDVEVGPGLYRPDVPTVFEEARAQLGWSEDDVTFVANTELLGAVTGSSYPGYGEDAASYQLLTDAAMADAPVGDDTPIFDTFRDLIRNGPPRLVWANCHDVDRAGHYGADDAYPHDVDKLDTLVSEFWTWLKTDQPAYAEDLLLVVVADHGRHVHDNDNGWHNHGDACWGCRGVPLFVLGGGANAGTVNDGLYTLADVAPTVASWLGVDLPWAEGLPLSPLFDGSEMPARSGWRDVAVHGALEAHSELLDDFAHRSRVVVDGAVLSSLDAFAAEAPVVVDGENGDWACFREWTWDDTAESTPWVARCFRREDGGDWTEIGFPADEVAPFWQPALSEQRGSLQATWTHNPDGIGELGADEDVGVRSAHYNPDAGWVDDGAFVTYYPMDPARSGDWIAFGTNEGGDTARYTRRVEAMTVGASKSYAFNLSDLLGDTVRVERPALVAYQDDVKLAMLADDGGGWQLAFAHSTDGGETWTDALLPTTGDLFGHLTPAWDDGKIVYAALVDGEAAVCRMAPEDAAPACLGTGAPRIRAMAVHDGGVTVVSDAGVGTWTEETLAW